MRPLAFQAFLRGTKSLIQGLLLLVFFFSHASSSFAATEGDACEAGQSYMGSNYLLKCVSGVYAKAPLIVGSGSGYNCDPTNAGLLQWTGTSLLGCNGSSWTEIGSGGGGGGSVTPFAFTDQTGVTPNSTISSNEVTLLGFTGTLAGVCSTNCTALARNGVWGGTGALFVSGDTIAIRQTSSSSGNTATLASVIVGSTTSSPWSVTTGANSPNAFSFTDQTDVAQSSTISSNAVTLTGVFSGLSATCGTGCTAIARNGTWYGTTATGFATGDTIAIRQTSTATSNATTTATVTLGTVTSSPWSITTTNCTHGSQTFTSSGTFTVPNNGCSTFRVVAVGGGQAYCTNYIAGGSGYVNAASLTLTASSSITVTVGAYGCSASASSFGAYLTAAAGSLGSGTTGGAGGSGGSGYTPGYGNGGSNGTNGTINGGTGQGTFVNSPTNVMGVIFQSATFSAGAGGTGGGPCYLEQQGRGYGASGACYAGGAGGLCINGSCPTPSYSPGSGAQGAAGMVYVEW